MKILQISNNIEKSGTGNHIKELSKELKRRGHSVCVIACSDQLEISKIDGINFFEINLKTRNPINFIKNIRQIKKIIEKNEIEIVHCHNRIPTLYMKVYNFFWTKPFIYTLHSALVPDDLFHRLLMDYGKQAIAISKDVERFLNNNLNVPKDSITYILNGVDESKLKQPRDSKRNELRKRFNIPKNKKVIALHSRISKEKNHIAVVEAVKQLPKTYREKLIILVSGRRDGKYYEFIKEKINEYDLNDVFVFAGWSNSCDVLSVSDALLLPSTIEGFPLSCVEAMFMKVPVTRSRTSGFEDIKDYVVELENVDPKSICKHIINIIDDKEYDDDIKNRALKFVNNNCTISKMTRKIENVYSKVLNE